MDQDGTTALSDSEPHGEHGRPSRAVIVLDRAGVVQAWTREAEQLLGITPADAIGQPLEDVLRPEWLSLQGADVTGAGRQWPPPAGGRWNLPARTLADSSPPLELEVVPVEVAGARLLVCVAGRVGSEATSVIPAREALQVLFERAPEAITVTDREGRQTTVNASGLRLLGFDDSFRTPLDGLMFVHPDDRQLLLDQQAGYADGTRNLDDPFRYRVRSGTGEWRWLETVAADLSDVPEVGGRVAFSRDVTDAVERSVALAAAEERLRALIASFGAAAILTGADDRVLLTNHRVVAWFRLDTSAAELVAAPVAGLLDAVGDRFVEPAVLAQAWRTKVAASEVQLVDGRFVDIDIVAIRHASSPLGWLLLFRDVTERRGVVVRQQALLALEQQARRDAELQSERLAQSDRLRMELVANTSHELRTPVTSIGSATELALSCGPQDIAEVREYLEIIQRNAARLREMVEDLLLVERMDAGMLTLDLRPVDLSRVAAETLDDLATTAAQRGVTLLAEGRRASMTMADRHRIGQVIENLVSNAIKFTAERSSVVVRVEPEAGGWSLSVLDHGPGIPVEQRAVAFDRFYRSTAADRAAKGSGLGLAIVKGLVEMHGGTVGIDDAPGGGALVRCWLPADTGAGSLDKTKGEGDGPQSPDR